VPRAGRLRRRPGIARRQRRRDLQWDGALELVIRDDGHGGADPARGSGLIGLADRVEALGGSIEVSSPPGEGTRILARLPAAGGLAGRGPVI
jgi:glucose-6-phosphate-specific signal transduction histidine kinase